MTRVLSQAVDACIKDPASYNVLPEWTRETVSTFEGIKETLGSYLVK